jgi:hypothetical protein
MGGEDNVAIPVEDHEHSHPPKSPHVITLAPTAGAHSPNGLADAKAAIAAAAAAA